MKNNTAKELLKRAVEYVRVSGTNQEKDGFSLPSQIKDCNKHAKELGYKVVETFEETFSGHYLFERPKLSELRENLRAGFYDAVIVHQVDRLARNSAHLAILVDEFERAGVELIFVLDKLEDTPEGRLMLSVKGYTAEIERLKIRERCMRGRRAKLQSGKLVRPSCDLFGYYTNKETGKRELVEQEAAVVRRIFDWYRDGHSMRAIAGYLTDDEIKTPGAGKRIYKAEKFRFMKRGDHLWEHGMVQRILRNEAYSGKTYGLQTEWTAKKGDKKIVGMSRQRDRKDWIALPDDTTPPIITPKEFATAKKRMSLNVGNKKRNVDRPALLRGLIYCRCGGKMSPAWSHPTPQTDPDYMYFNYRCTGRRRIDGNCGQGQVSGRKIEAAVWNQLCELLTDPTKLNTELKARRSQGSEGRKHVEANISSTEKTLAKVEQELTRLVERIGKVDESVFEIVNKEIQSRTRDRNRLRDVLVDAKQKLESYDEEVGVLDAMDVYCKDFSERLLPTISFQQKRALVEFFVEKVLGNKGEATVDFRIPREPKVWLELSKTGGKPKCNSVTKTKVNITELQDSYHAVTMRLSL